MPNTPLYWNTLDRLLADDSASSDVKTLVAAALDGDLSAPAGPPVARVAPPPAPVGVYLSRVSVRGFRGVGPEVSLDLEPGPGLVLIVGRNGSGKSSVAEGLEALLTGESRRWVGRKQKAWREGWRNLHHPELAVLRVDAVIEGSARPISLTRTWGAAAPIEAGELRVARGGETLDFERLGWREALTTFRPFLSYNELGGLLDEGPTALFDQLQAILGLGELSEAAELLRQARLSGKKVIDAAKNEMEELGRALAGIADPRAARAAELLAAKKVDLEALEGLVSGEAGAAEDGEIRALRQIVSASLPAVEVVGRAVGRVEAAEQARREVADQAVESSARTADLLEHAVRWAQSEATEDCPVCGAPGRLDAGWLSASRARIESLRLAASEVRRADQERRDAIAALRALVRPLPPEVTGEVAAGSGLPLEHLAAWSALANAEDSALPARLTALTPLAQAELSALVAWAEQRLATVQAAWRPVASRLAAFVAQVREARAVAERTPALQKAEDWLKKALEAERAARFEPIAAHAQEIWALLRQESNVDLSPPRLAGAATQRRVVLDVTIDGTAGVALGVMSQGELHALALSLFLPRLLLDESPFRFLVLDDPVQAMDPHKVDGLARVLESCAKHRQVLVFTHDARLLDAITRLGVRARVLQVSRRPGSIVALDPLSDPVDQYLSDAVQVAHNHEVLGEAVVRRIAPGFCRSALEAALLRRARRDLLRQGTADAEVQRRVADARTTHELAALALFGDATRGADVYKALGRYGTGAGDLFKALKESGHQPYPGSIRDLIGDTRRLCRALLETP
jgi:recombinational DNA repair ATPase RecF